MKLEPYLCMGGTEIANDARTFTYITNLGLPNAIISTTCPCQLYDEGYSFPDADPAPWYESTRPESADFLGFYATEMRLEPVLGRSTNARVLGGSVIGANRMTHRLLPVTGIMLARSALGMAYGERWLSEVLRGSMCSEGCASDDIEILPACPDPGYDEERYFRYLHSGGTLEGPFFSQADSVASECYIQQADFTLASQWPWLYHPEEECATEESLYPGVSPSCLLTTPEWMGDGTFSILVEIPDDSEPMGEITITGRISYDGECPVTAPSDAGAPCFQYTIPSGTLSGGDKFLIDGTRRQVLYYDVTRRKYLGGLRLLDFEGPFVWPDVAPCTSVCVSVEVEDNYIGQPVGLVTINSYLRET